MNTRHHKQRLTFQALIMGAIASLVVPSNSAQAATITRNFIGGDAPSQRSGNGNLIEIFNVAADYWEAAIIDDIELSIDFGWSDLPDTSLAEFFPLEQTENRALEAEILFNNNTQRFNWFLDATPTSNEEFSRFETFTDDLGAGEINTGRIFNNPNSEAQGNFDLLSIALHELGHAFGILNDYEAFEIETEADDDIDIANGLTLAGSNIPTTPINGGHLDLPNAALDPFFERGQRTLLSEADILAIATTSNLTQVNLNPQPVETPERSSILACLALIGLSYGYKKQIEDNHDKDART